MKSDETMDAKVNATHGSGLMRSIYDLPPAQRNACFALADTIERSVISESVHVGELALMLAIERLRIAENTGRWGGCKR